MSEQLPSPTPDQPSNAQQPKQPENGPGGGGTPAPRPHFGESLYTQAARAVAAKESLQPGPPAAQIGERERRQRPTWEPVAAPTLLRTPTIDGKTEVRFAAWRYTSGDVDLAGDTSRLGIGKLKPGERVVKYVQDSAKRLRIEPDNRVFQLDLTALDQGKAEYKPLGTLLSSSAKPGEPLILHIGIGSGVNRDGTPARVLKFSEPPEIVVRTSRLLSDVFTEEERISLGTTDIAIQRPRIKNSAGAQTAPPSVSSVETSASPPQLDLYTGAGLAEAANAILAGRIQEEAIIMEVLRKFRNYANSGYRDLADWGKQGVQHIERWLAQNAPRIAGRPQDRQASPPTPEAQRNQDPAIQEAERVAQELAKEIRAQGMGIVYAKFPSSWGGRHVQGGFGASLPSQGFFRGDDLKDDEQANRQLEKIFLKTTSDANLAKRTFGIAAMGDSQVLYISSYEPQEKSPRTFHGKVTGNDWVVYEYDFPLKNEEIRAGSGTWKFALPSSLTNRLDMMIKKDGHFLERLFQATYPGIIGSDEKTHLRRRPGEGLFYVQDYRTVPSFPNTTDPKNVRPLHTFHTS